MQPSALRLSLLMHSSSACGMKASLKASLKSTPKRAFIIKKQMTLGALSRSSIHSGLEETAVLLQTSCQRFCQNTIRSITMTGTKLQAEVILSFRHRMNGKTQRLSHRITGSQQPHRLQLTGSQRKHRHRLTGKIRT